MGGGGREMEGRENYARSRITCLSVKTVAKERRKERN